MRFFVGAERGKPPVSVKNNLFFKDYLLIFRRNDELSDDEQIDLGQKYEQKYQVF